MMNETGTHKIKLVNRKFIHNLYTNSAWFFYLLSWVAILNNLFLSTSNSFWFLFIYLFLGYGIWKQSWRRGVGFYWTICPAGWARRARNQPPLNALHVESMTTLLQYSNSLTNRKLRQADRALRRPPNQLHPLRVNHRRNFRLLFLGVASELRLLIRRLPQLAPPRAVQSYDVADGDVECCSAD